MPGNRKAAEDFIIKYIGKIAPGATNSEIYKNLFAEMTDADFEQFISDLESGKKFLPIIVPNFSNHGVTVENNLALAKELGHEFFQQLWYEGKNGDPSYLTPNKFLIVDLPVRRASQTLIKKISVPADNKTVDALSGQPTGDSKGARLSYPELQVCASMGLTKSMVELMKYRGGDNAGFTAMNAFISRYGKVNQEVLKKFSGGATATRTLKTFLTAAHLSSTL